MIRHCIIRRNRHADDRRLRDGVRQVAMKCDSTGSLCGNLLGALHGDVRLPQQQPAQVEGRATIAALADDLAAEVRPGESRPWIY
jgi:hypothetical protein